MVVTYVQPYARVWIFTGDCESLRSWYGDEYPYTNNPFAVLASLGMSERYVAKSWIAVMLKKKVTTFECVGKIEV